LTTAVATLYKEDNIIATHLNYEINFVLLSEMKGMDITMNIEYEQIYNNIANRTVQLPDGTKVPALGQGTWYMGENTNAWKEEVRTLQTGIELGMTLIDTAEMYGDGNAERLVGEAVKGIRDDIFLVSKVYPHNAGRNRIKQACENSLKRLGTEYLDLYLLHWRGTVPLAEVIEGMEQLKEEGKILRWGVSNLDTDDMIELVNCPNGRNCTVNQVLYHLGSRGIEYDLLPWQRENHIPVMAYSPLAQGGTLRDHLLTHPIIKELAVQKEVDPHQILLAWCIRTNDIIAIPKASKVEHVIANARAASVQFTEKELEKLNHVFPAPDKKVPLDII